VIQGTAWQSHRCSDQTSEGQDEVTCEEIVVNWEVVQACLPETGSG
jgi:hypothetical protein